MHKLLLADDSVTIQRVIELTFADEDMEVTVVGDGQQAIDRIQIDRPDIVLADIGMPERDGYEVAAFVKNNPQFAHIPVVLLTGAFEPVDEARAKTVGCDAVLVKPFEPQMVINRVKELLSTRPPAAVPEPPPPTSPHADVERGTAPPPDVVQDHVHGDAALEDYFDRLDAAFARLASAPRASTLDSPRRGAAVEELNPLSSEPAPTWESEGVGDFAPTPQPHLANAFATLLAAEQGNRLPQTGAMPPVTLSEETIEEIVKRVLARMADDSMRTLVLEAAERLVREEIDRIKRGD